MIILTTSLGADELKKTNIGFGKNNETILTSPYPPLKKGGIATVPPLFKEGRGEVSTMMVNTMVSGENKKRVTEKLKEHFSPELINRIDQICLFNSLTKNNLAKIAALEIAELNKQLEPYHTNLKADEEVFDWFVNQLPEINNAREVRRKIRNQVEKIMAELIMQDKIKTQHKLVLQKNILSVK